MESNSPTFMKNSQKTEIDVQNPYPVWYKDYSLYGAFFLLLGIISCIFFYIDLSYFQICLPEYSGCQSNLPTIEGMGGIPFAVIAIILGVISRKEQKGRIAKVVWISGLIFLISQFTLLPIGFIVLKFANLFF